MTGEQKTLDMSPEARCARIDKALEEALKQKPRVPGLQEELDARAERLGREVLGLPSKEIQVGPTLEERRIKALGGTGVLTAKDLSEFGEAVARIESLMVDGAWHPATKIIEVAGQREGLRRMRELRKRYTVERRRVVGTRDFEYRLVRP